MTQYSNHHGRLVIVSNRLPIVVSKVDGQLQATSGSGGLVTALAPVLKNRGGLWVGWPGIVDGQDQEMMVDLLKKENRSTGFFLHPIFLTEEEVKFYYEGFSNEIIWPLFHDLPSECHFDPRFWNAVQAVNEKFAQEIANKLQPNDFIWIHDYHLIFVGQELRKRNVQEKIGYFLHIPFPSPDVFLKLPWRFQVLRALLEYDLIGFQTLRDQRNFIQCVKKLLPDVNTAHQKHIQLCKTPSRIVRVGAFPISIDYQEFSQAAAGSAVINQAWLDLERLKGQKMIFSCDRLDISKGIPYRLEAIRYLLKKHPELCGKVTFLQIVIPSRTEIPEYQNLKNEIDRLVGEINSQFTTTGWVPIHYFFRSISRKELLSFYRISEAALITPVKDGMNLVAKEYVASNVDENGVLILSEFAGAAVQFQYDALLINPYDVEGVADTIYTALTLPPAECQRRMHKMRRSVQRSDVFCWVHAFLRAAIAKELYDFPIIAEYTPTETSTCINV